MMISSRAYIAVTICMWLTSAQSQQVAGDGICKGTLMPPGLVPVAELSSPECINSATPNAWELGELKDKVISCMEPNARYDPAPNISYVSCRQVTSDTCPKKFDGTANAFELRHSKDCAVGSLKNRCSNGKVKIAGKCVFKPYVSCSDSGGRSGASLDWTLGEVQSTKTNEKCKKQYLSIAEIENDKWPLCISGNEYVWSDHEESLRRASFYQKSEIEFSVVSRLYYDKTCSGDPDMPNAMIVTLLNGKIAADRTLTHCIAPNHLAEDYQTDLKFGGNELLQKIITVFHTDSCGIRGRGPDKLNALKLVHPQ